MPHLDVTASLLLVIDAQPGFYPSARIDVDHHAKDDVLDRAGWVCGVSRVMVVPTVVTEEDPSINGPTSPAITRFLTNETPVLAKNVFGAADNPEIWAAIESTGRRCVVLVGMETDVCVAHSALSLRERDMRVVIVHDAVFSAGNAHGYGLARLEREGFELMSAKEVYYEWVRDLTVAREFEENHPELAHPPGFSL